MHLPVDFAQYTAQLMGEARYNTFVQGLQEEAPVSIRLNQPRNPCLGVKKDDI